MSAVRQGSRSCGASPAATPQHELPPPARSRLQGRIVPRLPPIIRPSDHGSSQSESDSQASTPLTPPQVANRTGARGRRACSYTAPPDARRAAVPRIADDQRGAGNGLAGPAAEHTPAGCGEAPAVEEGPRLWGGSLVETVAEAEARGRREGMACLGSTAGVGNSDGSDGRCRTPAAWSTHAAPLADCARPAHSADAGGAWCTPPSVRAGARSTPRAVSEHGDLTSYLRPSAAPNSPLAMHTPAPIRTPPPSQPLSPEGRRALWSGGLPSQQPSPH
jgi:hypothetical protein